MPIQLVRRRRKTFGEAFEVGKTELALDAPKEAGRAPNERFANFETIARQWSKKSTANSIWFAANRPRVTNFQAQRVNMGLVKDADVAAYFLPLRNIIFRNGLERLDGVCTAHCEWA